MLTNPMAVVTADVIKKIETMYSSVPLAPHKANAMNKFITMKNKIKQTPCLRLICQQFFCCWFAMMPITAIFLFTKFKILIGGLTGGFSFTFFILSTFFMAFKYVPTN